MASAPFMAPPSRTAQALIDTTEMATDMTMTAAGAAYDIHRGSRRYGGASTTQPAMAPPISPPM